LVSIEYNFEILWYPQVDCFSHISLQLVLNVLADLISLKINARGSRSPGERRCLCPLSDVCAVLARDRNCVWSIDNKRIYSSQPTPTHTTHSNPCESNAPNLRKLRPCLGSRRCFPRFFSQEMRLLLFSRLLPFGLLKIELKLYAIKAATESAQIA